MAPFANGKVITAEGPLPVVTGHATKRAGESMVVKRLRSGHLNLPLHTRSDPMTFIASQSFRLIVFCMAEAEAE